MGILQADKDGLLAKIDAATVVATGVEGLTTDERTTIVGDLGTARTHTAAVTANPPPPPPPPPTTIPGAMPRQPGFPVVMPTRGYYWKILLPKAGPSAATESANWLNSYVDVPPPGQLKHTPRWGNEYCASGMPGSLTALIAWLQTLGLAELATIAPTPPPTPPPPPPAVVTYPDPATFTAAYPGGSLARAAIAGLGLYDVTLPVDPLGRWAATLDFTIPAGCAGLPFSFHPIDPLVPYTPPSATVDPLPTAGHYRVDDGPWVRLNRTDMVLPVISGSKLRVRGFPPYGLDAYYADVAAWRLSPYCIECVAFTSVDGRAFYRMTFTNPASAAVRKGVVMHRSQHPCEEPASWSIQGMVAWLLGGSPEALAVLNTTEVHVYGITNPDGEQGGWFRDTREVEGNRWASASHDTVSDGIEQRQIRLDLHGLMSRAIPVRIFMDWHNSTGYYDYLHHCANKVFAPNIAAYDPAGRISRTVTEDPDWITSPSGLMSTGMKTGEKKSSDYRGVAVRFPHRDVALRYGIVGVIKEYGYNWHMNSEVATIASAQAVGVSLLRATAAAAQTH